MYVKDHNLKVKGVNMAHEIMEHDEILSVREKPWHGIGDIIEDDISVDDARRRYLTWIATKVNTSAEIPGANGVTNYVRIPEKYAIMREDTQGLLGSCTGRYRIYQNSDMWDVIDTHVMKSGMTIETVGSLKNGKYTWILLKGDTFEVVKGDPIEKFLLFRNAFTGNVPVSILFTNVRVVCANTILAAFEGAKHTYNVRHMGDVISRVAEIEKMIAAQKKYQDKTKEALQTLSGKQMLLKDMKAILEDTIFPYDENSLIVTSNSKIIPINTLRAQVLREKQQLLKQKRDRKVAQVLDLVENGAGSDIIGVKGTAYGLYQAAIEWADHSKIVRTSLHNTSAARFENAMYNSEPFKINVMDTLLKAA